LPEGIGQGDGQLELDEGVVQVSLERGVKPVGRLGEPVGERDRFVWRPIRHPGIACPDL
jgi:hypothetical protein